MGEGGGAASGGFGGHELALEKTSLQKTVQKALTSIRGLREHFLVEFLYSAVIEP